MERLRCRHVQFVKDAKKQLWFLNEIKAEAAFMDLNKLNMCRRRAFIKTRSVLPDPVLLRAWHC